MANMNQTQMRNRALLADALSVGNGASGVAGVMVLLAWDDPRALAVACLFVFIGWGFDSVDGLAARGVKRSPAEGIVLDSLCDVSSFGVLPAVLLSAYGVRSGRTMLALGAIASIAFVSCVILRLRRYTVDALGHAAEARTSFAGVPSPVAAMSVSAAILAAVTGPPALAWLPIAFVAVTAPLMMSSIPYRETPQVAAWVVRAKWPLPVLAAVGYAAGNAAVALAVFFAAYVASGLVSRMQGDSETGRSPI
jgi:phosphatidylserine synthase